MKINKSLSMLTLLLVILSTPIYAQVKKLYEAASQDKHTNFELGISQDGKFMYNISYFGQNVVTSSELGF